jgi:hypothetical protein
LAHLGGEGEGGGNGGNGLGGGLYLAADGSVWLDVFSVLQVKHNHASTSNDDIFGEYTIC